MVRTSLLARTAARFEQILAEPVVAAAARQPGAGVDGARELAQLRYALTSPAMSRCSTCPWLPMALLVLWAVHPAFGAFAAASAVVLALMAVANDVVTRRAQRRAGHSQHEAQSLTEAMSRNAEPVLAMGMLDTMAARIGRLHRTSLISPTERRRAWWRGDGYHKGAPAWVQIGVMGLGAWLVLRSRMTVGATHKYDPRSSVRANILEAFWLDPGEIGVNEATMVLVEKPFPCLLVLLKGRGVVLPRLGAPLPFGQLAEARRARAPSC